MSNLTIERPIHFGRHAHGQVVLADAGHVKAERIPRVAKWLALAHRFDEYLRSGRVASQGQLAELGRVTNARMYQILNLLNLAPDIQEAILFLPPSPTGRDPVLLEQLQSIASTLAWSEQRRLWAEIRDAR